MQNNAETTDQELLGLRKIAESLVHIRLRNLDYD